MDWGVFRNLKHEIRIWKSETNLKCKPRMTQTEHADSEIRVSDVFRGYFLVIEICFGFRNSSFQFFPFIPVSHYGLPITHYERGPAVLGKRRIT